jgi:hypothetical protein
MSETHGLDGFSNRAPLRVAYVDPRQRSASLTTNQHHHAMPRPSMDDGQALNIDRSHARSRRKGPWRSETLTKLGSQTSHTAVVAPRGAYAARRASLQFCFGVAASVQASLAGAIGGVRRQPVAAEQMPHAPASPQSRRLSGPLNRPPHSRSLLERWWSGWCREQCAPAIFDRNECG